MSFVAVNVCLVCNAFDSAALPLSCSLCPSADGGAWDETVAYRLVSLAEKKLQRGCGHAHCTLAQLCVRATELTEVKEKVRVLWLTHRQRLVEAKEKLVLQGIQDGTPFGETPGEKGARLPSISLEPSDVLMALHADVLEALKPFQVKLSSLEVGKSAFHKTFPVNGDGSVQWMIDYFEKHSLENYRPHLTLGATQEAIDTDLIYFQETRIPWKECRLVVSHMGNYCSCFELLE